MTTQAMAMYIRLLVRIPDEPEVRFGVGGEGVGEAASSVGSGWAAATDIAVLVG